MAEQLLQRDGHLAPAEPGVPAEQLPCVDVAHGDELSEPALAGHAGQAVESRREDARAPVAVVALAVARDGGDLGRVSFLGEEAQREVAGRLVVVDEGLDDGGHVADRRPVALGEDRGMTPLRPQPRRGPPCRRTDE